MADQVVAGNSAGSARREASPRGDVVTRTRRGSATGHRGSRLDRLIDAAAQESWLAAPLAEQPDHRGVRRRDDAAQRARLSERYERLRADARFDDLLAGLRRYVAWTVPYPPRTERRYWVLRAAPSTNRSNFPLWCSLSINVMDTLSIACPVAHAERLAVRLCVDLATAVAAWGTLDCMARSLPDLLVEEAGSAVRDGVLALEADDVTALPRMLRLPGIADAARMLNLALMRRGPVPNGKGHCFTLADAVLDG